MANVVEIKGVPALIERLHNVQGRLRRGLQVGLKKAGLHLQAKSQEIVPVQLGNLKASAFTRQSTFARDVNGVAPVTVGYTAAYAVYVHENLEATHGAAFNAKHADEIANPNRKHTAKSGNFNRGENQQAKFLERPVREERQNMLALIRAEIGGQL